MTVADLLDQVTHNSDDSTGAYRTAALRWFNLCRSEAYSEVNWRTAMQHDATITTSAAQTDGMYELDDHEHVIHQRMWDETNEDTIVYESYQALQGIDPKKETTGPPSLWSDGGIENATSGDRNIYFWPIPDGTFTIRFSGYRKYKDILSTDESLTTDPIFGDIGAWGAAFASGIRYYQDLDDNESIQQIAIQERRWRSNLRRRKKRNGVLPNVQMQLADVRHMFQPQQGRFNPSNFNNQ